MAMLQVIPLGGSGEIGKNCNVIADEDGFVIVDVGLSFPNEEMPGVDIVIPDFQYIVQNKDKLRGIFLTHAHEDHIGALPYLLAEVKAPVYATEFTMAMIQSKLDERMDTRGLELRTIKPKDRIKAGNFEVEFIRVTHSIPEACCIAIHTAHGAILVTGDFKFDFSPVDGKLTDISRLAELGDEGVLLLLSDSTNVDRTGWGPSESAVSDGLRKAFLAAPGRVLITTFASNIHRMQQAFDIAAETGRKVAVAGRRMNQNVDLCTRLGFMRVPANTRIALDAIDEYAPERLVILTTGSQGEPLSALVQMSKREYSRMHVREGDTVLYCARPIPGNEAAIWRTVNRLFRIGANVIYESPIPIHVSGHAYQEELKMMINLTRPYYLAPVHGEPRHQHLYLDIARSMGYPDHRLFTLEDGRPLQMDDTTAWLGDPVPCGRVLVDNGGNPGVTDEVLRDRTSIASDGVLIVTAAIDPEAGELVGDPTIQAKGFSGPSSVLERAVTVLAENLAGLGKEDLRDVDRVRQECADTVRRIVSRQAQLRPLVVPAIVEV